MELKPCAECGKRVSDADIKREEGVAVDNKYYCLECAKILKIKSDDSVLGNVPEKRLHTDAQFFRAAGRLYEDRASSERPKRKRLKKKELKSKRKSNYSEFGLITGIMVGAILVLVVLIVMFLKSK